MPITIVSAIFTDEFSFSRFPDYQGEEMPICVIQYLFDGPEHEVAVRSNGIESTN